MTTTSVENETDDRHGRHLVIVNDHEVHIRRDERTGTQIKHRAIEQGAELQQDFQLSLQVSNSGQFDVIGDDDRVEIREGMIFVAVAGDDNS